MTATERKLDEARYFLQQLNPNLPYFDYILSAFLNAARSTPWVMRHEFGKTEGWEKWFKECDISESEKLLLERVNDWRITATKQSGIKTDFIFGEIFQPEEKAYPVIDEMLKEMEGQEVTFTISDELTNDKPSEKDGQYKFKVKIKTNTDESEMSREAISKICNEYYSFIEKQVQLCVQLFKLKIKPRED